MMQLQICWNLISGNANSELRNSSDVENNHAFGNKMTKFSTRSVILSSSSIQRVFNSDPLWSGGSPARKGY
jgi:hypothetical protein